MIRLTVLAWLAIITPAMALAAKDTRADFLRHLQQPTPCTAFGFAWNLSPRSLMDTLKSQGFTGVSWEPLGDELTGTVYIEDSGTTVSFDFYADAENTAAVLSGYVVIVKFDTPKIAKSYGRKSIDDNRQQRGKTTVDLDAGESDRCKLFTTCADKTEESLTITYSANYVYYRFNRYLPNE